MKTGIELIAEERARQVEVERWHATHDDCEHDDGGLTRAAICYATLAEFAIRDAPFSPVCRAGTKVPIDWPWDSESYKPKDTRRNLVRAGALIAAEIDRLQRATEGHQQERSEKP